MPIGVGSKTYVYTSLQIASAGAESARSTHPFIAAKKTMKSRAITPLSQLLQRGFMAYTSSKGNSVATNRCLPATLLKHFLLGPQRKGSTLTPCKSLPRQRLPIASQQQVSQNCHLPNKIFTIFFSIHKAWLSDAAFIILIAIWKIGPLRRTRPGGDITRNCGKANRQHNACMRALGSSSFKRAQCRT